MLKPTLHEIMFVLVLSVICEEAYIVGSNLSPKVVLQFISFDTLKAVIFARKFEKKQSGNF